MFIVNKNGDCIVEVNQINTDIDFKDEDEVKKKVKEIYDRVSQECLFWVSQENVMKEAEKQAESYLDSAPKVCKIIVNGDNFGEYDEVQGKFVFEKIVTALKNGNSLIDMREICFPEGI